jgi:hypothetical protein
MKPSLAFIFTALALTSLVRAEPQQLSDGKTFDGWEGDTAKTWRVQDGAFVGGTLDTKVPRNEFLCTKKEYGNFELRAKVKLVGTEGFVNGGIQFRSVRIPNPPNEMSGYQADMGEGYWGSLYDESRRRKALVKPDDAELAKVFKKDDWNDYVVRCEGPHIQLWINGYKTVDYTETEPNIPETGLIGVQIHGGGKAEAWYKDIVIEELPKK